MIIVIIIVMMMIMMMMMSDYNDYDNEMIIEVIIYFDKLFYLLGENVVVVSPDSEVLSVLYAGTR